MKRSTNGHANLAGMAKTETQFLDRMLAILGFRYIQRELVGFSQTTQTYAAFESWRQRGLPRDLAIERVLYG